jgi:glycosyltransferase involved in cell wall biosynthesis
MRILFLIKKWPGGVGRYVSETVAFLRKEGHIVEVVSRNESLKRNSFLSSILLIRKKVSNSSYDIIFTHDWSLALPLLIPPRLNRLNHFCCFHGHEFGKGRIFQVLVGKILNSKLMVVGDSLNKRFPNSFLNYEGVNREVFNSLSCKRDKLGWIKRDYELIDELQINYLAKKLNLKPFVIENVPFNKMNRVYNSCKVFISFPPSYTGFNLCWLEAMAAGVPYIFGNNFGIGERLNILKVDSLLEIIKKVKMKEIIDYKEDLEIFTWESHVNNLIKFFSFNNRIY